MKQRIWIGILLLVVGVVSPGWSQANPTQPVNPDVPINSKPVGQTENTKQMVPDTRPLSGAEQLTLGSSGEKLSTFQPQFSVSQMFDSNPVVQQGSDYQAVTVVSGKFDLDQKSQSQQLRLSYLGTGVIYPRNTQFDTQYHSVYVGQTFTLRRWSVVLGDQATYSPESAFGYGLGGFGGFGLMGGGLNPNYVPSQSILTGLSSRIDNSVVGQLTYRTGPRSSITTSVSYGLLHFIDGGRLNSSQITTAAGYDHSITARDTLGISYSHTFFRSTGPGGVPFETHAASLTYGRRVTGRLSLRLSAGPQIYMFEAADNFRQQQKVTYTADGSLLYHQGKTDISLLAMRGATGGSGVFAGAETYQLIASVSRSIGRNWQAYVVGGFARNKWLIEDATWLAGDAILNTVYAEAGVRRSLGRNAGMYFNYNALRQTGRAACIASATCDSGPVRHVIGVGFDFSPRPVRWQ